MVYGIYMYVCTCIHIPYHVQVTCSNQDSSSRHTYELWVTKTSLSLQKSVSSEVLVRSRKVNGKQYTSFPSRGTFPDSVNTHFEVSG